MYLIVKSPFARMLNQSHLVNINFVKSRLEKDYGTPLLINGDKTTVSGPSPENVKSVLDGYSR